MATVKRKKLVVVDGNAIIHRAYHALPPLTAPDGTIVNAVYGFAAVMLKVLRELAPSYVCVAFDMAGPTFRHKRFAAYKAQRKKMDQELADQVPIVHALVKAFGMRIYEQQGFEADDVIGTITAQSTETENIIVTGDADQVQLIDDHTKVYRLRKGIADTVLFDRTGVKQVYGFAPEQMIDFKALRGDPSDNIPGVRGIGEKTATTLIQQYGTIEAMYDTLKKRGTLPGFSERIVGILRDQEAQARESKELVTIVRNVPVDFRPADAAYVLKDTPEIEAFFRTYGFTSLLGRLRTVQGTRPSAAPVFPAAVADSRKPAPAPVPTAIQVPPVSRSVARAETFDYRLVADDAALRAMVKDVAGASWLAVDTETTSIEARSARLLGVSLSVKPGVAWYVSVADAPKRLALLKPLLEGPIPKVGHNMKYDVTVLSQHGIQLGPLAFDTMLAAYLLNPGIRGYDLDSLVDVELQHRMQPIVELIGPKGPTQVTMDRVPVEKVSWYACEDADFTLRLAGIYRKRLQEQGVEKVLTTIEVPLVPVLGSMERRGVKIDADLLGTLAVRHRKRLATLEAEIQQHAGREFNVNSPAQLKDVLFTTLKIDSRGLGKTKTGISTAADELEKLRGMHPIIDAMIEYREHAKLLSTYLEALPKLVDPQTGRVHTTYNQSVAATGRLSSSNPNLQNIPIRTEYGREIRRAFIADRGFRLVAADYSQIELRIIASMAAVTEMIETFRNGEDIHRRTAALINHVSLEDVTREQRRAAKEVNFGVLYGMGSVGLARRTGISRTEAKAFIEQYFAAFPEIRAYVEETKQRAREQGYVETLFGRRRYIRDIASPQQMLRARAEREAVNMPVQGTAADLMKLAMITVAEGLPAVSARSHLLLQVHDELVVESPTDDVEKVAQFLQTTMAGVYKLAVPIEVEVGSGKNWDEAH